MKVLYLTPGIFDKGGIARYNRYQIDSLRNLFGACNVTVLSLMGPSGTQSDMETPYEVDWHSSHADVTIADMLAFSRAVIRQGRRSKPDVVWCAHLHFAALAYTAAKSAGALDVVQVYGQEVWTPRWYRPDVPWGLRHANHVVADCHFTARYVEQHYRPGDNVDVMWDMVDTDRFAPGLPAQTVLARYRLPDPSTCFNVLTLGRIGRNETYKGYIRLLEVFAKLPERARLIYAGGGDLIPELQSQVQNLGVAERVTFTDYVDEAHLPDVYRSASVFCLIGDRGPGRGEGIPLTPLEAGACGVPLLVGNQDGSREAVEQGVNGFSIDPFDLETIGQHLTRLATDEDYRRRMGEAARRRVVQEHAYPVFHQRMRRFLEAAFVGRNSSRGNL